MLADVSQSFASSARNKFKSVNFCGVYNAPSNLCRNRLSTPPKAASAPVRAVEVGGFAANFAEPRFIRGEHLNRKGSQALQRSVWELRKGAPGNSLPEHISRRSEAYISSEQYAEEVAAVKKDLETRAETLARYIIANRATVRDAAKRYGISKSTVHKDISERLPAFNRTLYGEVSEVLALNKAERHIRGGEATRRKYGAK